MFPVCVLYQEALLICICNLYMMSQFSSVDFFQMIIFCQFNDQVFFHIFSVTLKCSVSNFSNGVEAESFWRHFLNSDEQQDIAKCSVQRNFFLFCLGTSLPVVHFQKKKHFHDFLILICTSIRLNNNWDIWWNRLHF